MVNDEAPDESNNAAVKAACTRFLSQHRPVSVAEKLRQLAASPYAAEEPDMYGEGGAVALLEQRVATMLGKPAALFFTKGVTAQLCSLRVHMEAAGVNRIGLHPQSHLDVDEAGAIHRVGGAQVVRLGRYQPFSLADVKAAGERLAALVIELPLRRSGYLLPTLDTVKAISDYCRERRIALHFDGARLWETAAAYGVSLSDLAGLADSVYLSFYKGLGGLGGAMLLGDTDHIAAVSPWKARFGGNHFTSYPQAISALAGLDNHVARMTDYTVRARTLAAALDGSIDAIIHPNLPHTNAFQLLIQGTPSELTERNLVFARKQGVWLFNAFTEAPLEARSIGEIVIGEAADDYTDEDAIGWLAEFIQQDR